MEQPTQASPVSHLCQYLERGPGRGIYSVHTPEA